MSAAADAFYTDEPSNSWADEPEEPRACSHERRNLGDTGASDNTRAGDANSERKSAATVLVEMALDSHTIGMSTDGEAYAVQKNGAQLVRTLRGGKLGLRAELAKQYRLETGKVAPQQGLADALMALEGEAADAKPEPLALRVAEHNDATYLDLGDTLGRAVRINADGWDVLVDGDVPYCGKYGKGIVTTVARSAKLRCAVDGRRCRTRAVLLLRPW